MTGNPTTQSYSVRIDTNVTETLNSFSGVKYKTDYFVWLLNGVPSSWWNAGLLDVLGSPLTGLGATKVVFTGSKWINYNGKASLSTTLTLTSDPIGVGDIILGVTAAILTLAPVIVTALGLVDIPAAVMASIYLVAMLLAFAVAINVIGSSAGNIAATGLLVVGGIALLILVPMAVSSLRGGGRKRKRRT